MDKFAALSDNEKVIDAINTMMKVNTVTQSILQDAVSALSLSTLSNQKCMAVVGLLQKQRDSEKLLASATHKTVADQHRQLLAHESDVRFAQGMRSVAGGLGVRDFGKKLKAWGAGSRLLPLCFARV